MDLLDIFALIVMAILLALVIWLVVLIGSMPGEIAQKRGHRHADAIKALGWIGLITMGVGWFVAFVWAYTDVKEKGSSDEALAARVKALESELEQLQGKEGQS